MTTMAHPHPGSSAAARPWLDDLAVYWLEIRSECLKTIRLPAYALPTLGFPLVFYVLFAVVFGGGHAGGTAMPTYLLGTYGCFGVMGAALFAFGVGVAVERGQGWMLVRRALPAPAGSWLVGKLATSLAFAALIVALLSLVAATVGHVRLTAAQWAGLGAVLVAGAVPFSAFGLALGYLCGPNSAPAVVNLVYLPMALLSGLWMPIDMFPRAMKSCAAYLPAYHYAQLALGVLGASRGGPAWSHGAALAGFTLVSVALALAAYRRDQGATFG